MPEYRRSKPLDDIVIAITKREEEKNIIATTSKSVEINK